MSHTPLGKSLLDRAQFAIVQREDKTFVIPSNEISRQLCLQANSIQNDIPGFPTDTFVHGTIGYQDGSEGREEAYAFQYSPKEPDPLATGLGWIEKVYRIARDRDWAMAIAPNPSYAPVTFKKE